MRRGSHGSLAARLPKAAETGAQLGLGPGLKSKIRDGSTVRIDRPHRTAVFDFRFRAPYELQLVLQSIRFTRPDPLFTRVYAKGLGPLQSKARAPSSIALSQRIGEYSP